MVTLPDDVTTIPLYCIASKHSEKHLYNWKLGDDPVGISSPVLYATKSGVYLCVITEKEAECMSTNITMVKG